MGPVATDERPLKNAGANAYIVVAAAADPGAAADDAAGCAAIAAGCAAIAAVVAAVTDVRARPSPGYRCVTAAAAVLQDAAVEGFILLHFLLSLQLPLRLQAQGTSTPARAAVATVSA